MLCLVFKLEIRLVRVPVGMIIKAALKNSKSCGVDSFSSDYLKIKRLIITFYVERSEKLKYTSGASQVAQC